MSYDNTLCKGFITIIEKDGAHHKKGLVKQAQKRSLMDLVEYRHKYISPKHFTLAAVNEYGYTPRSKKYMIRKARKMKHQLPLVFTGESRKKVLQAVRVAGTSALMKGIQYLAPKHWFQYRKDNGAANKILEFATHSETDVKEMVPVFEELFPFYLNVVTIEKASKKVQRKRAA